MRNCPGSPLKPSGHRPALTPTSKPGTEPMKAPFLVGHLLGAASAPLCVTGFALGRRDGQLSSVALADGWTRALVAGFGAVGALVALPGALWLFAALPDTSPWRALATIAWLMLVGGIAGYACGRRAG